MKKHGIFKKHRILKKVDFLKNSIFSKSYDFFKKFMVFYNLNINRQNRFLENDVFYNVKFFSSHCILHLADLLRY